MLTVQSNSLITLHYQICAQDSQVTYISTYDATPATLQMGSGELNPNLQKLLLGLAENEEKVFFLSPEDSFGCHNKDLIYAFDISLLPKIGEDSVVGSMIRLESPDGSLLNCRIKEIGADSVWLDFNHPLAGQAITFKVNIISIL